MLSTFDLKKLAFIIKLKVKNSSVFPLNIISIAVAMVIYSRVVETALGNLTETIYGALIAAVN